MGACLIETPFNSHVDHNLCNKDLKGGLGVLPQKIFAFMVWYSFMQFGSIVIIVKLVRHLE